MSARLPWRATSLLALTLVATASCHTDAPTFAPDGALTLRRTKHGVLHVEADTFHGAGFGVGYAYTEDNRCLLLHRIAEVNGRLSASLGADADVTSAVHDLHTTALRSDHYFRGWFDRDLIRARFSAGSPDVLALAEGYAAGVNRYLGDHPELPPCEVPAHGTITRDDVFMIWVAAATVASGEVFAGYLPHAAPSGSRADTVTEALPMCIAAATPLPSGAFGSNAWALGRDAVAEGTGMHLYNPHFPWSGIHRLYMLHVTVRGDIDVFGAALGGMPLPLAGFNHDVAWGLTFSPAARWSAAELVLEDDGTTYLVDGEPHVITRETLSIPVRGESAPRRIPFFRADGRPVIHAPSYLFGWTRGKAYAVHDVNADNTRIVEQFLAIARATSIADVRGALETHLGVPWSYTLAVDRAGDVFFGDVSTVPDLPSETIDDCVTSNAGVLHLAHGFVVLDGNRAACAWEGPLSPALLPAVVRSDYVANSNNDYEIPNLDVRLAGYSQVLGGEGKSLSLRASLGLDMIMGRLDGTDGLGAPGFTTDTTLALFASARNRAAELLVDGIVADCTTTPTGIVDGQIVDITDVCGALAAWDLRNTIESHGAHVFHGLWRALDRPTRLFAVGASIDAPRTTPSGYTTDPTLRQAVRDALARVHRTLEARGIAPGARWGDVQRVLGPDGPRAIPGGWEQQGLFDATTSTTSFYTYEGWEESLDGIAPESLYGASYHHLVTFDASGPRARGVMPYSQATEPTSPYYLDQLDAWSNGAWFDLPFAPEDVATDPELVELRFE